MCSLSSVLNGVNSGIMEVCGSNFVILQETVTIIPNMVMYLLIKSRKYPRSMNMTMLLYKMLGDYPVYDVIVD